MIVEVNKLSYFVPNKEILHQISFSLKAGGFYIVVGSNGSGKTTLLKCLSGSLTTETKCIKINNEYINTYSPKRLAKQISIVPQNTEILFDFSALQIVMMGRMPYQKLLQTDSALDYDIVRNSMIRTNTWHLRNRSIKQLSGGELQRTIIARALAQQTPIMLLDEPISNLDIRHQFEIMELLKRINQENQTTIFIILHDLNLALKYADEVLVIDNGELIHKGKAIDILTKENIENIFGVNANIIDNSFIHLNKKQNEI